MILHLTLPLALVKAAEMLPPALLARAAHIRAMAAEMAALAGIISVVQRAAAAERAGTVEMAGPVGIPGDRVLTVRAAVAAAAERRFSQATRKTVAAAERESTERDQAVRAAQRVQAGQAGQAEHRAALAQPGLMAAGLLMVLALPEPALLESFGPAM